MENLVEAQGFVYRLKQENGKLLAEIIRRRDGNSLKQAVEFYLPENLSASQRAVINYIVAGVSRKEPRLVPFALANKSLLKLAEYLYAYRTASLHSIYSYIYGIDRYCRWIGQSPDELIKECYNEDGAVNLKVVSEHARMLERWLLELKAQGIASYTIKSLIDPVKCLYKINGIMLPLPYTIPKRVEFRDRAPTPEELQRLIDIGDLREKVIVSLLALGGFRIGTLCKLQYRHVKHDLELNIVPLHVHVEAEITKGKYHDYDTFLASEAVEYLKAYLEERRRGTKYIPPERITDSSPLIRSRYAHKILPVREVRLHKIIHSLYERAGLTAKVGGRLYEVRPHSIRKFFRTQLAALGVPSDYIEYMMGHKISTYHDIQMKGVEFLRGIYAASGLSIRPKTRLSKIEALKEIIRAWGMNPEEILTREALAMPARTVVSGEVEQEREVKLLASALKDMMRKELLSAPSKL